MKMRYLKPFQNKQQLSRVSKARQRYRDSSSQENIPQNNSVHIIGIEDEHKKRKQKNFYMSDFQQRKYASSLYREEEEPILLTLIKIGSTIVFLIIMALIVYLIQWLFTFSNDTPSTNFPNMNLSLHQEETMLNLHE